MSSKRGFTLLELLLGMAMLSLVLSGIFVAFRGALLTQQSNFAQERVFNEGRRTLNIVTAELRQATITSLSSDGKQLEYVAYATKGGANKRITIDDTANAIYIDDLSQSTRTMYASGLLNTNADNKFMQTSKAINLTLNLNAQFQGFTRTLPLSATVVSGVILF